MYFSQEEIFVLCSLLFVIHFSIFFREDSLYCKFICQETLYGIWKLFLKDRFSWTLNRLCRQCSNRFILLFKCGCVTHCNYFLICENKFPTKYGRCVSDTFSGNIHISTVFAFNLTLIVYPVTTSMCVRVCVLFPVCLLDWPANLTGRIIGKYLLIVSVSTIW